MVYCCVVLNIDERIGLHHVCKTKVLLHVATKFVLIFFQKEANGREIEYAGFLRAFQYITLFLRKLLD